MFEVLLFVADEGLVTETFQWILFFISFYHFVRFWSFLTLLSFVHQNRTVNLSWSVWIDVSLSQAATFPPVYLSGFAKRYLQEFLATVSFEACSILDNSSSFFNVILSHKNPLTSCSRYVCMCVCALNFHVFLPTKFVSFVFKNSL